MYTLNNYGTKYTQKDLLRTGYRIVYNILIIYIIKLYIRFFRRARVASIFDVHSCWYCFKFEKLITAWYIYIINLIIIIWPLIFAKLALLIGF